LYVQKEIFKMTDDQIKEEQKQIKKEASKGEEFIGDDIKAQRKGDIEAGEEEAEEPPPEEEAPAKEPPVKKEEPPEKEEPKDKEPPVKKEVPKK
jgi:hypothetical protein